MELACEFSSVFVFNEHARFIGFDFWGVIFFTNATGRDKACLVSTNTVRHH